MGEEEVRGSKMDLTFLHTLNIHTHTHPFIHALQGKDHLHIPGLRYLARDGDALSEILPY